MDLDPPERLRLAERLARVGCVAPEEEAAELAAAAPDRSALEALVAERVEGVPLAWLTGGLRFAGVELQVHRGVYVPRHQTEALALEAAAVLGVDGTAVDLCTGCGAVAAVLAATRPRATVLATELDPVARRCAAANGVTALAGHLADPLPAELAGQVDVVTAVVPYVPTAELSYLPRDVLAHEPRLALDGGAGGTALLRPLVAAAGRLLRPGGHLLAELGGHQDRDLAGDLDRAGFEPARRLEDGEGDLRAIHARRRLPAGAAPSPGPGPDRPGASPRAGGGLSYTGGP